ncbi:MAG TPA: bleomycin resistance protein [Dermatophilaceae bacterium]|nr:bleomycin resistance protein [Dermatophilaceae bacterium]
MRPQLFHALSFRDADAGLAFLRTLGFTEVLVVRSETDPGVVEHAQLRWRDNGGVMCGSGQRAGDGWERRVGVGSCYLVVDSDAEVDVVHARALSAGGRSTQPPRDEDYGGRGAAVQDAEGNQYSIGSYPGE